MKAKHIDLCGLRFSYCTDGQGPVIVLIHGMASSSHTWDDVLPWLAERYTVVAPDLLGHGDSSKPRGDYSLGAHANGLRDLLDALGHSRATIVGHSLGGGVALQFAYQFPERCDRMILVSSGGLGREVNVLLRAAALPGAELLMPLVSPKWIRRTGNNVAGFFKRLGLRVAPDLAALWEGYASLADADARQAFLHTLRTIVDLNGQRVSAEGKLHLMAAIPMLLVWGSLDPVIPVDHGHAALRVLPHSRLEVFDGAGHFPHRDNPRRFVQTVVEFVRTTTPARLRQPLSLPGQNGRRYPVVVGAGSG